MTRETPARPDPWAPYAPTKEAPWDLRRVVHLHRRAGFAATWDELQRDLKDGPRTSIDRVLAGKGQRDGVPDDFERVSGLLADSAVASRDPQRLKAWWVYRMLFGPDALGERLTLLWHNHFATGNDKVNDLAAMHRQNEVFRKHARAPFGELLGAAVREPALLLYLDAQANRKGHPNENLARELMELFTLGVGHFSEQDVKEAARALTGWTVDSGAFAEAAGRHDDGDKTILGKKGRWTGSDLVKMLLDHPATARRLAGRVVGLFMGEGAVEAAATEALAEGLRRRQLDVGWAVETVLRSQAFFADGNLRRRVTGPVEYVVGSVRALGLFDPPASTLVLADWAGRLGQDLFYPPNVGGWPGGRAWLTTRSLLGRMRFAVALAEGSGAGLPGPPDLLSPVRRQGADPVEFFARLLLGGLPSAAWRDRLVAALDSKEADADRARRVVALVLSSPEAQIG
jgi:uncharacterized protein (DUF1800 family)